MTSEEFIQRFGYVPKPEDLDKIDCPIQGVFGHLGCGYCEEHKAPRSACWWWHSLPEGA